ncbi:heterokaryon incompatibility protein-domain-containing protein [Xylariales sp. PMI_506]|nr:heterokaryon incompatibility protein-domain-containing protein [Xylariales sp. PMI_506]
MNRCTDFCTRLGAISSGHGALPTHDELVTKLGLAGDEKVHERELGTWQVLQGRQCDFCRLVVAAVRSSAADAAQSEIKSDQLISVLLFPGEQSFRLSFPSPFGLRLAFNTADGNQVVGPDTARPVTKKSADVGRIRNWLETCALEHQKCALDPSQQSTTCPHADALEQEALIAKTMKMANGFDFQESATSNFRVLDLELGCVKPAALDVRYAALSYVWGQLPTFKLRSDNFDQLSKPRSLGPIRHHLPKTVNDAIDFVLALGERYLWVDTLCLVQDDADDVALGIELMNSIYQGSYFTIVAASGTDADAGLPGVGSSPRSCRAQDISIDDTEVFSPDLGLTILYSIDWHLRRSIYNKRGWTLQELVLPRRTIVFIDSQALFRCQEANWAEGSWADKWTFWLDADDSNITRMPDPYDGFLPSFWAYQKLCEDYSHRSLRRDGDALRAFAGILRPLAAGMETMLVEGLPGYYLDHFLLFMSSDGDLRRRPEFASFSWAGWKGRVMWPRENYYRLNAGAELTWEPSNIISWFKHSLLIEFEALDQSGCAESLSYYPYEKPSLIFQLMQKHRDIFTEVDVDPLKTHDKFPKFNRSSLSHGDVPDWYPIMKSGKLDNEERYLDPGQDKLKPKHGFVLKAFNLANGQAEYMRLLKRLERDGPGRYVLLNWCAQRNSFVRTAKRKRSKVAPRSVKQDDEAAPFRFRQPILSTNKETHTVKEVDDIRATLGRHWIQENPSWDSKEFTIPIFPPYTVLQFIAASIRLSLGQVQQSPAEWRENKSRPSMHGGPSTQSPFKRIPGIPLHCNGGEIVGSLHPDNFDLLGPSGSVIECILLSRCSVPTVASALLNSRDGPSYNNDDNAQDATMDLFWILHVVWQHGIAERRGVGQVLASVLTQVEVKLDIKQVLLG